MSTIENLSEDQKNTLIQRSLKIRTAQAKTVKEWRLNNPDAWKAIQANYRQRCRERKAALKKSMESDELQNSGAILA